jgi:hypothetical protein
MLGYFLNERGLIGNGIEVGSAAGQYATKLLSAWKGKALYMVDPWEKQAHDDYLENTNNVAPFAEWHASCVHLSQKDERAHLMKMTSKEASEKFRLDCLDFVYIDGNHDYRHVLEDLELWYNRVKPGGLVGGHDCYNDHEHGASCDVFDALRRWTREHDIAFTVTTCTSWWFIK